LERGIQSGTIRTDIDLKEEAMPEEIISQRIAMLTRGDIKSLCEETEEKKTVMTGFEKMRIKKR
jgi:hypothetical protein